MLTPPEDAISGLLPGGRYRRESRAGGVVTEVRSGICFARSRNWGHSMGVELSRRRWATRLSLLATTLALLTGIAAEALAQRASAPLTGPVDERALATLEGNTRPEANVANDRGAVAADMRLDHMILQLRRSPAQETAVERFADSLQDPASPNYHR